MEEAIGQNPEERHKKCYAGQRVLDVVVGLGLEFNGHAKSCVRVLQRRYKPPRGILVIRNPN
ncbi:hypothetical protein AKJ16_DCAP10664 [Drosera capensis]